jgi:ABC-type multidrug transport system fused ATPase/permease subunit
MATEERCGRSGLAFKIFDSGGHFENFPRTSRADRVPRSQDALRKAWLWWCGTQEMRRSLESVFLFARVPGGALAVAQSRVQTYRHAIAIVTVIVIVIVIIIITIIIIIIIVIIIFVIIIFVIITVAELCICIHLESC